MTRIPQSVADSFHTQSWNESRLIPQGIGRDRKGREGKPVPKVSCGVSGSDRIRSNGDLRAFGFGDER